MLKDLLRRFTSFLTEKNLNIKAFNYSDRSTGLRSPDAPTGVLLQDSGVAQLYSGNAKLVAYLTGDLSITGRELIIGSNSVTFNINSFSDFKIKDRVLNNTLYNNSTLTRVKSLDAHVITPQTAVVEGKLINTKPLSEYLEEVNLFTESPLPEEYLRDYQLWAEYIDVDLPEWI